MSWWAALLVLPLAALLPMVLADDERGGLAAIEARSLRTAAEHIPAIPPGRAVVRDIEAIGGQRFGADGRVEWAGPFGISTGWYEREGGEEAWSISWRRALALWGGLAAAEGAISAALAWALWGLR